jgi:hypothetical protein
MQEKGMSRFRQVAIALLVGAAVTIIYIYLGSMIAMPIPKRLWHLAAGHGRVAMVISHLFFASRRVAQEC